MHDPYASRENSPPRSCLKDDGLGVGLSEEQAPLARQASPLYHHGARTPLGPLSAAALPAALVPMAMANLPAPAQPSGASMPWTCGNYVNGMLVYDQNLFDDNNPEVLHPEVLHPEVLHPEVLLSDCRSELQAERKLLDQAGEALGRRGRDVLKLKEQVEAAEQKVQRQGRQLQQQDAQLRHLGELVQQHKWQRPPQVVPPPRESGGAPPAGVSTSSARGAAGSPWLAANLFAPAPRALLGGNLRSSLSVKAAAAPLSAAAALEHGEWALMLQLKKELSQKEAQARAARDHARAEVPHHKSAEDLEAAAAPCAPSSDPAVLLSECQSKLKAAKSELSQADDALSREHDVVCQLTQRLADADDTVRRQGHQLEQQAAQRHYLHALAEQQDYNLHGSPSAKAVAAPMSAAALEREEWSVVLQHKPGYAKSDARRCAAGAGAPALAPHYGSPGAPPACGTFSTAMKPPQLEEVSMSDDDEEPQAAAAEEPQAGAAEEPQAAAPVPHPDALLRGVHSNSQVGHPVGNVVNTMPAAAPPSATPGRRALPLAALQKAKDAQGGAKRSPGTAPRSANGDDEDVPAKRRAGAL